MLIRMVQEHATVLDGIGILLCLLIACYLIYNRLKYDRMLCGQSVAHDFGDQMKLYMVPQQTRRALMSVMAKVNDELKLLETEPRKNLLKGEQLSMGVDPQRADSDHWVGKDHCGRSPQNRLHESVAAVSRLMETGMGILDISRSVQRPVAEIELCAWLAHNRNRGRKNVDTSFRRQ